MEKVFVRYVGGKENKVGFVAEYTKKIADILVKRGQVEIITDPYTQKRVSEDIAVVKESAVHKRKKHSEAE